MVCRLCPKLFGTMKMDLKCQLLCSIASDYIFTRELPGVCSGEFFNWANFYGKGNTLNYIDILIALKKLIHLCQKPANDTQF